MNFGADMMRHQPNDPFAIGRRQGGAAIREPARQPIHPQSAIGVEHHLDDGGVFQEGGNGRPQRRAQHARAANKGFGPGGGNGHNDPRSGPIPSFGTGNEDH